MHHTLSAQPFCDRWNNATPPRLTVAPCDTVTFCCADSSGYQVRPDWTVKDFTERFDATKIHSLTGPVAIEGAAPGDTLEIVIEEYRHHGYAWTSLIPGLGLLNVTSPDLLHRGWSARQAARWNGGAAGRSHVESLLRELSPQAGLVTIIDGSPSALSWLGGVRGQKVSPLGLDRFGQTGDLPDLYREYRLDRDAIADAAAELFLRDGEM